MKRDLNLIREILLRIEAKENRSAALALEVAGYTEGEVDYNLDLLLHEGLVNGDGEWTFGNKYYVSINGLTWSGHDFLDSIREDAVWEAAAQKAQNSGHKLANLTIDVAKGIATSIIRERLGL